jgi:hypothetical protein
VGPMPFTARSIQRQLQWLNGRHHPGHFFVVVFSSLFLRFPLARPVRPLRFPCTPATLKPGQTVPSLGGD